MGFRVRKSVRLSKGVRVNLSKSGPSISVKSGPFTTNVGARGMRQTTHIEKGVSYTTSSGAGRGGRSAARKRGSAGGTDEIETMVRTYAAPNAFQDESAKLARDGWVVANVTEHRVSQGCLRLMLGGFLFPPRARLVVTYARSRA